MVSVFCSHNGDKLYAAIDEFAKAWSKNGVAEAGFADYVNSDKVSKNAIPNDPQSPFVTSGVRLGTAAVTSRGMKPEDMDKIAEAIAMTLKEEGSQEKAKAIVKELTDKYPLVG